MSSSIPGYALNDSGTLHVPIGESSALSYSYSSGGSFSECPDGQWIVESLEHGLAIDLLIPHSQRIMLGIVAPLMAIVGLILNAAFFFVLLRVPDMQTTTNFYLANLAVADCLFLVFSTAINMWQAVNMPITGAHPFQTDYGCGLFFWMNYLYYFASISFVTLVTLDRYMAVCHAIRYRNSRTKIRTMVLTLSAWGVACLFAAGLLPNVLQLETHCYRWPDDDNFFDGFATIVNYCTPLDQALDLHWDFPSFVMVMQILPFIIAMVTSIYFYTKIISTLSKSSSHRKQSSTLNKKHQQRRNQIAFMLLVMASCFFICECPFLVSSIFHTYVHQSGKGLSHDQKVILTIITRIFLYLNSSINPIIYNALSPTYRRAFATAFNMGSFMRRRDRPSSYRVSSTKVSMLGGTSMSDKGINEKQIVSDV